MPTQTYDQLLGFLNYPPRGQVALVGAEDPELGPYTKWIHVAESDIEQSCSSGHRKLTRREKEALIGDVEDYTSDWKHSD